VNDTICIGRLEVALKNYGREMQSYSGVEESEAEKICERFYSMNEGLVEERVGEISGSYGGTRLD